MKEDLYLLYSHYDIREDDDDRKMIDRVARKVYREFARRVRFFKSSVTPEKSWDLQKETGKLLSELIPDLLTVNSQESFDKRHHEICEAVIHVYDSIGKQPYGIAQRWLNLTLLNLAVIESSLEIGYWNTMDTRQYFHVPVEQYVLEAAASKYKDRFRHGLYLKCAPLRHEEPDNYQMDWFIRGETQPFEVWEYSEYIEFQLAVRNKIKEISTAQEGGYKDVLDWAIGAFMEVSQARNV